VLCALFVKEFTDSREELTLAASPFEEWFQMWGALGHAKDLTGEQ
jgi:hypothetical protein